MYIFRLQNYRNIWNQHFNHYICLLINNNGQRLLNYHSFIEEKRNCITFRDKYGNCIRFVQLLKKSARD